MSLADVHTQVSRLINRGSTFDSQIPSFVKQAARFIERNYTLKYMERVTPIFIAEGESEFYYNEGKIKSIEFIRLDLDSGEYIFLKKGDPEDFEISKIGRPSAYWLEDETSRLVLDRTADLDYNGTMFAAKFTSWPTDDSKTPWLVENAEEILIARAVFYMAPLIRNPQLGAWQSQIWNEGIMTLLNSDQELRTKDGSHIMKQYVG